MMVVEEKKCFNSLYEIATILLKSKTKQRLLEEDSTSMSRVCL